MKKQNKIIIFVIVIAILIIGVACILFNRNNSQTNNNTQNDTQNSISNEFRIPEEKEEEPETIVQTPGEDEGNITSITTTL